MIHATAIISDSAVIADDVEIGAYSVIGDSVEIGSGTRIDSHVVVNGPTKIGKDNHIYQFASIGDDKKYADEPTRLIIGDRNTIREFCTFSRGTTQDTGDTIVGDDNWVMAYVHIAHDCVIGNKTIMANNTTLAGHVQVGDWVICGGFSGVHLRRFFGCSPVLQGWRACVPRYVYGRQSRCAGLHNGFRPAGCCSRH
jgi:UDP-N-acetylglucosamine acyltransferase